MKKIYTLLLALLLLSAGCNNLDKNMNGQSKEEEPQEEIQEILPDLDYLQEIGANELGRIMIIEYHTIGEEEGRWARTYTNMRKDLEKLYDAGYVAVSLNDMARGNLDIPAGKTPVVITLDDGTQGHFRFIEDEEGQLQVDPKSAVGILENFYEDYPDFGLEATFFINGYNPFGQSKELSDKKIKYIIEKGMDIGNHSVNHPQMNKLTQTEVAKELLPIVKLVDSLVPGYKVETFALPFGIGTKEKEWAVKGQLEEATYENVAVLLVGSTPAPSPYNKKFDPYALERVQVFEDNLDKWLEFFEKNPEQRYISDGFDQIITLPESLLENLDPQTEKEVLSY